MSVQREAQKQDHRARRLELVGQLAGVLAASPRLRVLLVSGYPRDADLSALPKDRALLLSKPFTAESFHDALLELLPNPADSVLPERSASAVEGRGPNSENHKGPSPPLGENGEFTRS